MPGTNDKYKTSAIDLPAPTTVLVEHADAIRALHGRIVSDVAEIGRILGEVKQIVGHGNWLPWLEREFGWSEDTAERFIRVHEFVEGLSDSATVRNLVLTLPVSSVYLLAAPSTPVEARDAVIERAAAGETFTVAEVKRTVAEAKGPKPAKKETTPPANGKSMSAVAVKKRGGVPPSDTADEDASTYATCSMTSDEYHRLATWSDERDLTPEEGIRRMVRERLDAADRDDTEASTASSKTPSGSARLAALENKARLLEAENIGLKSELEEARAAQPKGEGEPTALIESLSRILTDVNEASWIRPLSARGQRRARKVIGCLVDDLGELVDLREAAAKATAPARQKKPTKAQIADGAAVH